MKNENCRTLYRYWNQIRGDKPAPARTAVEPSEISELLRDTFILQAGDYVFRLAGTRLCACFGVELKGAGFLDLWAPADRAEMKSVMEAVSEEGRAAVLGISAHVTRHRDVSFELLFLPLIQTGPRFDRILGVMAPMQLPYWLGLEPIVGQSITSTRLIWPDEPRQPIARGARFFAPTDAPPAYLGADQRRRRFVVLEGGKSRV
jgi:hypothetical protein